LPEVTNKNHEETYYGPVSDDIPIRYFLTERNPG